MKSIQFICLSFAIGSIAISTAQTTTPPATTTSAAAANRPRRPVEVADPNAPVTKYDYHDAFAPFFFTKNGTEYRAATGEPGPKYWQNRADYQLAAKLNDSTNEITGTEVLTYTNNSPLKLGFIWMMLEQNLFKASSFNSFFHCVNITLGMYRTVHIIKAAFTHEILAFLSQ